MRIFWTLVTVFILTLTTTKSQEITTLRLDHLQSQVPSATYIGKKHSYEDEIYNTEENQLHELKECNETNIGTSCVKNIISDVKNLRKTALANNQYQWNTTNLSMDVTTHNIYVKSQDKTETYNERQPEILTPATLLNNKYTAFNGGTTHIETSTNPSDVFASIEIDRSNINNQYTKSKGILETSSKTRLKPWRSLPILEGYNVTIARKYLQDVLSKNQSKHDWLKSSRPKRIEMTEPQIPFEIQEKSGTSYEILHRTDTTVTEVTGGPISLENDKSVEEVRPRSSFISGLGSVMKLLSSIVSPSISHPIFPITSSSKTTSRAITYEEEENSTEEGDIFYPICENPPCTYHLCPNPCTCPKFCYKSNSPLCTCCPPCLGN